MTVEAVSTTEVVDLRGTGPVAPPPPAHQPWPTPPSDAEQTGAVAALRRRRRFVLIAVLVLLGVVMADFLIGRVVHDQHQRHLTAALQTPSPHPQPGDPVLLMQIPSIGLNQVIVYGADSSELRGGPGLVATGAMPGKRGTAAILGHRYRYGGPFGSLHDLHKGAEVLIVGANKLLHRYTVSSVTRVAIDDRPLASPRTNKLLLVTSDGGLWPDKSLVVTLAPKTAPSLGRPPAHAVRLDSGSSAPGLLFDLVLAAALLAALVLARKRLRAHYRPGTVLAVLVPIAALAILVVVMSLDLALSAVY